jgi:transglutaminase-like putative cysteine protease
MKKMLVFATAFFILFTSLGYAAEKNYAAMFDNSKSNLGIIGVSYGVGDKKVKLVVEKGQSKYTYNLKGDDQTESFPLQLNDGNYKVSILENISGTSYKTVAVTNVDVKVEDKQKVFLNSIQLIEWNDSMKAIEKAKELTKDLKTDEEKIAVIHKYIIESVRYDYDKISNLKYDYLPNIESTYTTNKGICYDYSSLFAGMLRSIGIPTKLIKGNTKNAQGFHAWNEVYVNEKWMIVDTTYDAQMKENKLKYTIAKNSKDYDKTYEY